MSLKDKKVITIVDNNYNDLELWYPIYRLQEDEVTVHIVGEEAGKEYTGQYGVVAKTDYGYADVKAEDYDGILIPGGWAPDKLRRYPEVKELVQKLDAAGKTIGSICHAGWVLVSADVLKGRTVTSTPAIKDDMKNAGANWVNQVCCVDDNFISSRSPADMPAYMKEYIKHLDK